MTQELAKTFDPAAIEARWYQHWETNGLFRPERPAAQPFTIVNPPPNVTGSLHIGHALDNTLQDVVVRYERLKGKDALWVVGTDHAGIATQMVVERELEKSQDKRTNYSREDFVAKVWEWKAESGGTITRQLRRLGCSMDWSREQFTMDPHFTKAVTKVFVDLYNQGLLYRDKRLVNWDPKLKTAISDLEVETQDVPGKFWHLRYPLADASGHVSVATTRPETMLADMAVAVHPSDERYTALVGTMVKLPLTGRLIPIIADEHADPELGSGAVKITPGHDFNDFEVGKRAGFKPAEMLNMLDGEARVTQTADGLIPDELVGLDRFVARDRVVAMLEEQGLLENVEDRTIPTPFGDRGGVVIEPWLTDQWYVDAEKLAQAPIQAVRDGRIEIVPKSWEKTWFNWMENIQPWCVSRQLWWGHRIPAWFGPIVDAEPFGTTEAREIAFRSETRAENFENEVFVAEDEVSAISQAASFYRVDRSEIAVVDTAQDAVMATIMGAAKRVIWRDEDVLDTWFSSALWPFATLGWPEAQSSPSLLGEGDQPQAGGGAFPDAGANTPPPPALPAVPLPETSSGRNLLARHYPNDLLISGTDILFFWDARMAMQGMQFMGEVPWRRLYLHGLVRAADGQKMSKSKGNVVDPLGLIDRFGADALRFFMAAMESHGRDLKMDEKRVEGYRNFATKLWNAARFCQANGIGASKTLAAPQATSAVNKWIVGEVVETLAALDKAMADLRFDAAANAIYHFVWDTFCDWYLELIKPVLGANPNPARAEPIGVEDGAQPQPPSLPSSVAPEEESGPSTSSGRTDVEETREVAGWVLDQILVMLHPFMPFVTEELWHATGERPYELIVAKWPEPDASVASEAKREVETTIDFIRSVRSLRTEYNVPPGAIVCFYEMGAGTSSPMFNGLIRPAVEKMARVRQQAHSFWGKDDSPQDNQAWVDKVEIEQKGVQFGMRGREFALLLEDHIDVRAERQRLRSAKEASEKELDSLAKRLSNPAFVEKAKPEAVDKARADHAHHAAEAERLAAALARLG